MTVYIVCRKLTAILAGGIVSPEVLTVLVIMLVTIALLVLEVFRIDLVAVLCMLALGWTGILTPSETLSGFSSNAVISMIAVMVMGTGIARTGVMNSFSRLVISIAGKSMRKIVGLVSLSVGVLSAFMQNVGAAALFLPAVLSISKREKIPASRLIMPLGFAAILGGTLTMVASGPLILLNDLLRSSDLEPYGLFSVTPVGLVLLGLGIVYFLLLGKWVLPGKDAGAEKPSEQKILIDTWRLPGTIHRYAIPSDSPLVGQTPEASGLWSRYGLHILAVSHTGEMEYAPWRKTSFADGQEIALLGNIEDIGKFAGDYGLVFHNELNSFEQLSDPGSAGFAEVLVPPRSVLVGGTIRDFSLRKRFAVEPVVFFSGDTQVQGDFSDRKIKTGDTLIVHGMWENLSALRESSDFIVITPFEVEKQDTGKAWKAVACFLGAIILTISGFPISMSLFSGALAMVLLGVIKMDEFYHSIEWKVVFLIAGLIPLGIAMQKTGAAQYLAGGVMSLVQHGHPLIMLLTIAMLSTLFSLFMSNVAATVVLAPLVVGMAEIGGLDPRPLVLLVAVCAANSFILPTHQVNAMLITPGGYRNRDYFKAGGGMTLLFLVAVVAMFYMIYL